MNDVILILQMKQGDEQAFDKFVRKYYGGILSYCKYHCLDQTEAEDLTQETFLLFFASLFCIKLQKVFVGCCTCIL